MKTILKWGAGILGGAIAAMLIILVVGSLLPVRHEVSRSRTFAVPASVLWDLTMENYRRTNDGTYSILESRPHEVLVTGIARKGLPFGGTWRYELAPRGNQTSLTITERGEVYNPFFRFMSRFVFGYYGSIDKFFAALSSAVDQRRKSGR